MKKTYPYRSFGINGDRFAVFLHNELPFYPYFLYQIQIIWA